MATLKFFFHDTDTFEPQELEVKDQPLPVGPVAQRVKVILEPLMASSAGDDSTLRFIQLAHHVRSTGGDSEVWSFVLSVTSTENLDVYEIVGCCHVEA